MKTLRVKTNDGQTQAGWLFGTFKGVNLVSGKKPRQITGWQITSPDGVERFSEGNYQQFVPFANLVLDNYGCRPSVS